MMKEIMVIEIQMVQLYHLSMYFQVITQVAAQAGKVHRVKLEVNLEVQ